MDGASDCIERKVFPKKFGGGGGCSSDTHEVGRDIQSTPQNEPVLIANEMYESNDQRLKEE